MTRVVAGIGCRGNATLREVEAALDAALDTYHVAPGALSALATGSIKRDEPAIIACARNRALPLVIVEDDALRLSDRRGTTRSAVSLAATGLGSLSEAAALAAAGPESRLSGPRIAVGPVTCALAIGEVAP